MYDDELPLLRWIAPIGYAIGGLGMLFVWFALAHDAWRRWRTGDKPPRCPKCWYNMTGSTSLVCPECGHAAHLPGRLMMSRRRWRRACYGATLIALAVPLVRSREFFSGNWIPKLPNWVLIVLVEDPCIPNAGFRDQSLTFAQKLVQELWARYGRGELSLSQRRRVATLQFTADRPPFVLETRREWPRGSTVYFQILKQFDGAVGRTATIRVQPGFDRTLAYSEVGSWDPQYPGWWSTCMPVHENIQYHTMPLLSDVQSVDMHIDVYEENEVIWSGVVITPIELRTDPDLVIQPIRDDAIDQKLLKCCMESLRLTDDGRWIGLTPPDTPDNADITFGLKVTILDTDREVAYAELVWTTGTRSAPRDRWSQLFGGSQKTQGGRPQVWRPLSGNIDYLARDKLTDVKWTVRVNGSRDLALRDIDGKRYWFGEFTLPASYLVAESDSQLPDY